MIQDIIKYVSQLFNETKQQHIHIDDTILKSCLVYQYLYFKHFKTILPINNILYLHDYEIGLIGPGNGCMTQFLEHTLGWINILQTHSILHDAFGRFYDRYLLDRGYCYAIPENATPYLMKKSALCGQISGLFYCLSKRIIT